MSSVSIGNFRIRIGNFLLSRKINIITTSKNITWSEGRLSLIFRICFIKNISINFRDLPLVLIRLWLVINCDFFPLVRPTVGVNVTPLYGLVTHHVNLCWFVFRVKIVGHYNLLSQSPIVSLIFNYSLSGLYFLGVFVLWFLEIKLTGVRKHSKRL